MGPGVAGAAPFYCLAFHDSGAVVLEWYRRRYAGHLSFDDLAGLAEKVPVGSDGLICLPLADTYPDKDGFLSVRTGAQARPLCPRHHGVDCGRAVPPPGTALR